MRDSPAGVRKDWNDGEGGEGFMSERRGIRMSKYSSCPTINEGQVIENVGGAHATFGRRGGRRRRNKRAASDGYRDSGGTVLRIVARR